MSFDPKSNYPQEPRVSFGQAVAIGIGAGAIGALVMLGTEKIEQLFTGRPNSYVPATATGNLFGLDRHRHPDLVNHVHHFGMGMMNGPIRAVMSYFGVIGPFSSFMFTGIRIFMDQWVEISAGASALPWTWPINEQIIDIFHKGVYAIISGYLCDRYIRGVTWFN
ncbi:hypothetical protein H2203_007154 [Taxawa tesnikishii (nom. ined.)]|nr:hypothetical protein H2203_007154 [Dothideales sp. JES 119]